MAKKNKQIARLSGRSFLNGGLTPPKLYREDIDELIRQQEREKKKKQAVGLIPQFIPNDRIVTDLKTADLTDEEYNQAVQMAQKRNQMMSVQSPIPKDLDEFEKWYQDTSGIDLKTTTEDEQLDIYADRHRKKNGVDVDNMTYAEVLSDYEGLNDEISELEKQISQRQTIKDHPVNGYGKTAEKFYAKNSEQLDLIQKRKQELEQKKEFYDEILNDKDFHKKALETDDDGKWAKDNVPNFSALEYFNSLLDIQKDPTKSEEEKNSAAMKQIVWGVLASPKVALGEDVLMYAFVSPEEREIYNSIHSHYGKEEAERYFSTIKDDVLQREADFMVDQMMESDNGWTNNPVFRSLFSFKSRHEGGLKGFLQDIRLLSGDTEPVEKSAYEYAYDEMRPQLTGVEGFANDLVGGLGNNLPASSASLATFLVTGGNLDAAQAVGSSVTAIQVFGESFRQAKQEEKADEEAYLYATLEALKEAGLEYAIGGDLFFSSGGTSKALKNTKIGSKVMEALKNGSEALIKNPVARRTAKNGLDLLVHAGDEFVEEATQEATEPLVRNIAFGEENEFELWNDQIAYAGLLGAGTSAVHNTAYRAVENSSIKSAGKQIKSSGQVQEAVQAGFKAAEGGKAWELAQDISKKQAAGKTPSDYEVGLLGSYLQEERTQKQAAPEQEMELEPSENTGGEITLNPDTYAQTQTRLTEMGVDKQAAAVQAKAIERLKLGDTSAIHTILESPEAKQLLARDTGVVFGTTPEQGRRAAGEIAARAQSQAGRIRQEIQPEQAASTVRQNDQQQTDTSAMQPMDHMTERETATAILPAESPALQPQTASAQQGFVPDPVMESGQSAPLKTVSEVRKPQAVWADSGEPVQVTGIQSAQNGELYVRADSDSGSTVVRASDLSYQSPEVELIYQTAAQLGTSGAKAFVYGYQPGSSFDSYYKGFMRAYHAGTANTPFEQIGSAYTAILPKETARRAYYAGQNDQTERFTNAGERSTIKTKQVKDVTYTYQAVPEGRRSENAGTIVRELELLGLGGEAIEPGLQVRQNGKMRTSQGDASTLKDGHVVVRNDTDANPKNAAAHEAFHAWRNLKLPEANAYFDAVTDGNIDFSSEKFQDFLAEFKEVYFTLETADFEVIESERFREEISAFVSGALYENTPTEIQRYAPMFYDWEMVETAWQKMIEAGKRRKQDDRRRMASEVTQADGSTQWEENRGRSTDAGRGSQTESPMAGNGKIVAEKTGRTPEAERGRPRSIPQVEREGRPGNEGIYGQRSLLGLESSEAEGGAGKGRKQDGQGLGRDYGSQGFELGGEDSENPGRRGPMAGNGEIVAEGTGRTPEAESGRPRSIPQVEREGRPGNEGIYGQRSLLGLESSEAEGGAGKGQQGQTTGLAQNEAAKKLKGSQRAYLHVLGKLSNSRIVLDDTIQGGRANGYYDLDTGEIHIALDAVDSAYDFVAKHELTHQLQQLSPEHYRQYFDHVVSYLNQAEPDAFDKLVQKQLDGYREMGKKITRQQAMDEVVADASDAFLRDSAAIRDLVSQNRTLGQKVLDAIRSMIRKIDQYLRTHKTLHTDAARLLSRNKKALEEAQRLWTNALLSAQKNTAQQKSSTGGDVRFSIRYTTDNTPVVVVEDNILDSIPKSKWVQTVKDTISNKFSTGIPISGRLIKVNSISRSEFTNSKYSKYLKSSDGTIYQDKFRSANNLDDIILASTNYINEDLKHSRNDKFTEFARGDVLIRVGSTDYSAKVIVGFTSGKQMVLYDIINFVPTSLDIKNKDNSIDFGKNRNLRNELSLDTNIPQEDTGVNDSISKNDKNVRFSIKRDADGSRYVQVDEDILEGVPQKDWTKTIKTVMSRRFSNGIPISGRLIKVNKISKNEFTNSKNTQYYRKNKPDVYQDKLTAAGSLDEIVLASTDYINEDLMHSRKDNFKQFARGNVTIRVGRNKYDAKVIVGFTSGNQMVLYDIVDFKRKKIDALQNTVQSQNKVKNSSASTSITTNIPQEDTGVNDSISQNDKNVRFSLKGSQGNQYDYSKSFAEQIDDYKAGKIPKKDTLVVGPTPDMLQKIGLNALPMTINTTHVDYALNGTKDANHFFGRSLLSQLPTALKNPAAVISSQTQQKTSLVVLLPIKHLGNTVIAPVYIDGFGRQNGIVIDSNAVTSTFGKKNAVTKLLNDAIQQERNGKIAVYYYNKKIADPLLQVAGLQLPGGLIPHGGYVHSIREKGSPVNNRLENVTYSQQFKRWFGDWEKHPNTASKVVNKDSTPRVMYQDLRVENSVKKKDGSGLRALGKGNYFTSQQLNGSSVIKAYLDIKNPFVYQQGALDLKAQFANASQIDTTHMNHSELQQAMKDAGYDGVIQYTSNENMIAVAFDSTQIKSATDNIGTFDGNNPDIRFSLKNVSKLDYETLVSKPDMLVTTLTGKVPLRDDERIDRTEIINQGLQSLKGKDNGKNVAGRHYVYVDDIDEYVSVNRKAIEHGLSRKADATAKVTLQLGDILQHAIYMNELNPRNENVLSSYVLLGVANDKEGFVYPVRFVVNQFSDSGSEISQVEVLNALYSAKAKKMKPVANASATIGNDTNVPSDFTISIAELLDMVKDTYPDILPQSVLDHYGIGRPKGGLSNSVKFSLKNVSKLESENLIERYTQTEYNDYGWVAVNEVLTPSELRKLNTQFADMLHGEKFSKNRDGYYIIPVGEENKPQNSFVFIKGTISHPKISQILRIDVENEAELDIIRGDFGERRNFESREIIEAIYGQETVYQYSAGDFEDYQTLRNQGQTAGLRRNAGSNRGVSDGGRDQSGNLGSLQDKDQVTFSLKNVSKLDYDNLIKENKKQKEMISLLEEQFQVTKGIKWDKASIDRTAQRILKQYDSTYSVQDLSENLTSLYGYLKNNPDTNTDEVHSVVTAMSKSVLEHSRKLDDAMYQEYKELRDRIRGTRLTLSDADKADLDRAGGYHQFRRDNFGRLNLTNQGIPVDVFYQELQTLYPEFFAGEEIAHPADQLIRIAEVLDTIRPVYVNPYGMNLDEAAGVLANELLESYVDIPQAKPTYADRELQKRKKLKLEYQKKIREIKAEYKAKYEEKLKEVNRQNILNIRKIQEQLKKTAAADRETIKKLERQVERLKKYNQNITHAKTAAMSVSPVTSVSVPVKKSDSSVPMKQVISEAPSYVEAAKQYGTIPKGESPVRDVAVPAQTGENNSSVKEQLKRSSDLLNRMDEVATVNDSQTFGSKQEATEWVLKRLESTGYLVKREGFGEIVLDKKRISSGMRYLKTTEELLAFAAVPQVLRKGLEIGTHEKHKGRTYDTVTFAAPVRVNGQRGNLAVVVRQEEKNYYKVHRLVMPDGTQFIMEPKKEDIAERAGGAKHGSGLSPTDNVFHSSINQAGAKIKQMADAYGTIPKGESPVRDVAVPAQTGENARVRQFARTAIEAGATPDGMISEFEREILNGAFDYNPISDKTAQREAELTLSKKGFDGALKQWKGALKNQKAASKDDIVLAEKLYVQAAKEGNYKLAMELAAEIAEEGTRAGQTVQAMRLLNKMSGEGQLVYIERTVDRMNQDLKSRREKGKAPYLEIPQEMKETLLQSKTREEIDRAAEDIYRQLASRLPVTFADKWNAWRYLSMLGNPRTHVRNLTGNAVFLPAVKMKNLIATGLEHVYRKAGGEIERTKAFRATKESLDFAKKDYEIMADIIAGGGKMNPSDVIRDYQKIFPFKTLEKARKFNFNALEAEDRIFLKRYYVSALAGYMTANQIDPNAFVSQQILERARNYAIQEAQKATYRDASKVAGMLQHLSKTNSALGLLVEGVLPFKKTPVNILKRGVEYSPAGLLYSLTMGAKKVKTGKITAAEYIDSIASGLSGTVLFALGALLQSLGILRGGEDDDKKKEQFDRNMGYQPYSLQIGDISYTIDWLAPSSLPLFVGARVFETLTEEQEDYSVSSFAEDLQMIAEPVLSLSMLSGLNDTLSSVSYGDNGISDIAANVLASYFGQAVPTLFGQAARTVDGTRRTTYTDKNMDIPSDLQYFFQKNQNKIPAASMLSQPYIDLWGREDTQENILIRAFENFVSPGYLNAVETSAVEQELVFIYEETGDAGVFPSKAAKYFQVDGQRKDLTAQEYTMFAKAKGQKAYSLLWEMMATQAYREASAQEKAELIADVYEYATVFGKTQVSAYSTNGWKAKALQADQNGESVVEVILNRKRG